MKPFSSQLTTIFRNAECVVAFSGAGISSESGVPTFRGTDGIWSKFKPEELANFDAFMSNPELVWEWYRQRKEIISRVQPNPAHYALVKMEQIYRRFAVITQNIDNLHQRAGSKIVHELHGNIERNYCTTCGKYYSNDFILAQERAPRCPSCNGLIRPDVVWFGELLPEDAWKASVAAAESAQLFFVIGTSAVVHPAASLPSIAKRSGAYVVEINIETTEFSMKADEVLLGKAGEVLPALINESLPHTELERTQRHGK